MFSVVQWCLTLCDPCSPSGSSVHEIFQARILQWVAISYSRGSSEPRDRTQISCVSCIGRQILYHCTTWEAVNSVQAFSHVQLFATPWTVARQASMSITNSWSLLKLMSTKSVMPPTISSSVVHFFSCFQSFPTSVSFPVNQFFTSGGQSVGASRSASDLPLNILEYLGLTGWISLQSKGLSRVFSNTTVQKHQFFGAQFSL